MPGQQSIASSFLARVHQRRDPSERLRKVSDGQLCRRIASNPRDDEDWNEEFACISSCDRLLAAACPDVLWGTDSQLARTLVQDFLPSVVLQRCLESRKPCGTTMRTNRLSGVLHTNVAIVRHFFARQLLYH
eukprot:763772-Hanusia_phi.AAC.4